MQAMWPDHLNLLDFITLTVMSNFNMKICFTAAQNKWWSLELWKSVVFQAGPIASTSVKDKDGGSIFLCNVCNHL
jgi:hypothetical protein